MSETKNFLSGSGASSMPEADKLLDKISSFEGKTAFEITTEDAEGRKFGNHGDVLMYAVFQKLLTEGGIRIVENEEDADLLIVRPNGALLESYQFPDILTRRLAVLPDKPLIIFPSSALFPTTDPALMFGERNSPTLWVFREKYSYDHVFSKWAKGLKARNVELFLDHDVVASGHRFVPDLIGTPLTSRHIILAGRIDSEAEKDFHASRDPSRNLSSPFVLRFKKKIVSMVSNNPESPVSRLLAKTIYRDRLIAAADGLFNKLPSDVKSEIETSGLPIRKVDLSSQIFVSFNEYVEQIRNAAVIVTDRLHVALPAAIVGKQVYLVEAGYYKLTGVYQQSLKSMPNVTLINAYSR